MINRNGELRSNAGKFARGAVVSAFELMGGVHSFTQWARENPNEYYTKIFSKLIGKEVEQNNTETVETALKRLSILDGDYEIVEEDEPEEIEEIEEVEDTPPPRVCKKFVLSAMAEAYAEGEDGLDD